MRGHVLALLFRKELLDVFRDRRTIFTMMVLPMLIMPLSMMVTNWTLSRSRRDAETQRFRIAINRVPEAQPIAGALRGSGFDVQFADDPRDSAAQKKAELGVFVAPAGEGSKVTLFADQSDGIRWQVMRGRVRDVVESVRNQALEAELKKAGLAAGLVHAYRLDTVNLAKPQRMAGAFFGGFLAFILVIFLLNGAMYAAVDTTAGEKERRTMEMLLSSAATRTEIVLSKVSIAATVSLATAMLSVVSMVISFVQIRRSGGEASQMFSLPTDPGTFLLVTMSVVPMAILASAVAIALATPARSTREGMSYLTPAMFAVMLLGSMAFFPAVADSRTLVVVPVANFTRTLMHLLRGEWSWVDYGISLGANFVFAAVAVALAVRKFGDERMLLRV